MTHVINRTTPHVTILLLLGAQSIPVTLWVCSARVCCLTHWPPLSPYIWTSLLFGERANSKIGKNLIVYYNYPNVHQKPISMNVLWNNMLISIVQFYNNKGLLRLYAYDTVTVSSISSRIRVKYSQWAYKSSIFVFLGQEIHTFWKTLQSLGTILSIFNQIFI